MDTDSSFMEDKALCKWNSATVPVRFSTVFSRCCSGDLALVSGMWQKGHCVHSELGLQVALGLLLCSLGVLPETRKLV